MNKTIFISFFAVIIKHLSSLAILPVLARTLSPDDLGLWFILISMQFFVFLLDLGFNSNFIRFFAMARAGASQVKAQGDASLCRSTPNITLLRSISHTTNLIYSILSLACLAILLLVYEFYIKSLVATNDADLKWGIFFIYALNVAFLFQMNSIVSFLTGIGDIRFVQASYVIQVFSFLIFVVVFAQKGSLELLIKLFIMSTLIQRSFLEIIVRSRRTQLGLSMGQVSLRKIRYVFERIKLNTHRSFLITLGTFLSNRALLFFISATVGLAISGSYAIFLQLATAIVAASMIPINVFIPRLIKMRVNKHSAEFKRTVTNLLLIYVCLSLSGLITLVLTYPYLLPYIGSQHLPLSYKPIMIIAIFLFLEGFHASSCLLITTYNIIPHTKASIITGILVVFGGIVGVTLKFNLELFLLIPLCMNLIYNNWYWPLYLCRLTHADFSKV